MFVLISPSASHSFFLVGDDLNGGDDLKVGLRHADFILFFSDELKVGVDFSVCVTQILGK